MKIVDLGSANIDRVYSVRKFVRPGETVSATGFEIFPGGKGLNQAIALARAGAKVCFAGKLGEDGAFLAQLMEQSGVELSMLLRSQLPTGHAVIQVEESGQNCILLHGGANQDISRQDIDRVLAGCDPGDYLLLQNEISNMDYILSQAEKLEIPVVLNPSPITPELLEMDLRGVRVFVLNELEGQAITGCWEPREICRTLVERYPRALVVLTLGRDGAVCADASGFRHWKAYSVDTVDTTAAGDTFTGFFLAAYTSGKPLETCLEQASKAAAISVSRSGAASSIPLLEEVLSANLD